MKTTRRDFIVLSVGSLVGVGTSTTGIRAAFAETAKLSEADPAAKAVGYTEVATKVDKARYPNYAAGQTCSNCSLFQGSPTDAYGGCTLFGTKQVAGAGWCSS
jgi:hypothetical protein